MMPIDVDAEVKALNRMTVTQLRQRYAEVFALALSRGDEATAHESSSPCGRPSKPYGMSDGSGRLRRFAARSSGLGQRIDDRA